MPRTRIVVTGMGCISPLGHDVASTWKALCEGRSGVGPITLFDPQDLETKFAAEVKDLDAVSHLGGRLARRTDRYTQLAFIATAEALKHAELDIDDTLSVRAGAIIGTGIGGIGTLVTENEKYRERGPKRVSPFMVPMMLPDSAAGQIAISFGLRGPNMAVVTACASSSNAIGEAMETIRRGAADVMITGGAEAAIVPLAMAGFNSMSAISTRNEDPVGASRPFDLNRDGFVVGEGAAALVLESLEHALARNANILAEMSAYASTNDAFHISAPAENGAGAAACMQLVLDNARLKPQQIDYINAHGTSTPLNDLSETMAIKTVFGELAYDTPISSIKSMTGHLMGAGGALETVACVQAIQDSLIPPTINYETPDPACDLDYVPNKARSKDLVHVLNNSFGFGGHNTCLIVSRWKENGNLQ